MKIMFQAVIERLKTALKLQDDKALAAELGLLPNAFYNRRRAGSLPYDGIIEIIQKHKMCADWVFFGIGRPFLDQDLAVPPIGVVNPVLFQEVCFELESAFLKAEERDDDRDLQYRGAIRGGLGAVIYNKVAFIENPAIRRAAIRTEAELTVQAAALAANAQELLNSKSR